MVEKVDETTAEEQKAVMDQIVMDHLFNQMLSQMSQAQAQTSKIFAQEREDQADNA